MAFDKSDPSASRDVDRRRLMQAVQPHETPETVAAQERADEYEVCFGDASAKWTGEARDNSPEARLVRRRIYREQMEVALSLDAARRAFGYPPLPASWFPRDPDGDE